MIPITSDTTGFLTNPAIIYVTHDTIATTIAYGNWVDTWFRWLHWAPAEAMIVVSLMGETWSPNTAPARQAETPTIIRVKSALKTSVTMGMRMPKVPQEVPVANASPQATR